MSEAELVDLLGEAQCSKRNGVVEAQRRVTDSASCLSCSRPAVPALRIWNPC